MPTPVAFQSVQAMLDVMGSLQNRNEFDTFFQPRFSSIRTSVIASVGSNTFRAFHFRTAGIENLKPSTLYRDWTTTWVSDLLEVFPTILDRTELRHRLIGGAQALNVYWDDQTAGKNRIGFGRAAKLLGLSVKHALCIESVTQRDRTRVIPFLDVPLDSYTLVGISLLLPEFKIPANATMSFVRDEAHYVAIQDAITRLCSPEFSPAHYEIAAWNVSHAVSKVRDVPYV